MIAIIIKAKVCVICRSRRLRRITQTEALIIIAIMRKPNPIIVLLCILINNYWMRLSMIAIIIKAKVCVICRSRRLRRITQTETLIIIAIMRKPNPIIVLLCILIFLSCTCKEKSAHKKVINVQQSTCK